MTKIKQYRPAFFEGFKNEIADFKTLEELLDIEWIKSFKSETFFQFSISVSVPRPLLMAEYNFGKDWLVVGLFSSDPTIDLPKWKHPER